MRPRVNRLRPFPPPFIYHVGWRGQSLLVPPPTPPITSDRDHPPATVGYNDFSSSLSRTHAANSTATTGGFASPCGLLPVHVPNDTPNSGVSSMPKQDRKPTSHFRPAMEEVKSTVVRLTQDMHKGECGKVLVIGGAEMYTGAPFFSAMSALRTGADLAYVVCEKSAAPAIKSYSPDVIVHPYLVASTTIGEDNGPSTENMVVEQVSGLMLRMDVVVIGPGLGRDEFTMRCIGRIIEEAKKSQKLMVLDGDALFLVHNRAELVKGYELAVVTPNVVEFDRLCKSMNLEVEKGSNAGIDVCDEGNVDVAASMSAKLARAFGGLTVVQKGKVDVISNGVDVLVSDEPGGLKRCGGQGDLLAGCLAVWLLWSVRAATSQKGTHEEKDVSAGTERSTAKMPRLASGKPASLVAAYGACTLIRAVSKRAYERVGRGVQSSDMLDELPTVFRDTFESSL